MPDFKFIFLNLDIICHAKVVEQLLCGVVSHFLLSVVHCRRFNDNRNVTTRRNGNNTYRHLNSEYVYCFIFKSETLVIFLGVPWFKLNNHVYLL